MDLKLNSRQAGVGPSVVLLHGLFASLSSWLGVSRRLTRYFTIYAVDLRNHGDSFHSTDFNYPVMAEDLKIFLDQQKLNRAHLVGHSLGGKVAMQFAADFPQRLSRLVVVDMAPRHYPPALEDIFEAMLSLDLSQCADRATAVAALGKRIPCLMTRRFLAKNLVYGGDGRLKWRIALGDIYTNRHEIYRAVCLDRPVEHRSLFIQGGDSDYILPPDQVLIKNRFPNSRMVVVGGAGHFVHVDAPGKVSGMVLDFLR